MDAHRGAGPKRRSRSRWILNKYAAEVEGDLAHYFQTDLRDLWRPRGGTSRLTWRRLGVLIDWLPTDSATKTAIRDGLTDDEIADLAGRDPVGYGRWSRGDLRTAAVEDAVERQTALMIWLASDRKSKPKMPEPVRRPGIRQKRAVLTAEGREYLQYLRDNRGALPPGYAMMRAN